MTRHGHQGRVDALQGAIVLHLSARGCSVQSLASVGRGVPDLLVGRERTTYLLEVKRPGGRLTADQERWHQLWRGHVAVVHDIDEALRAVGLAPRWVEHDGRATGSA